MEIAMPSCTATNHCSLSATSYKCACYKLQLEKTKAPTSQLSKTSRNFKIGSEFAKLEINEDRKRNNLTNPSIHDSTKYEKKFDMRSHRFL